MLCTFCDLNEATSELPNSRGGLDPVCDNCRAALEEQAYDDYMADREEQEEQARAQASDNMGDKLGHGAVSPALRGSKA